MADPSEHESGKNLLDTTQEQPDIPVSDDNIKNESENAIEKPSVPQESEKQESEKQESEKQESEKIDPTLQCMVEDPVEILVGLAERGEIDPWNINIIEVTDRFLSELERCRQLNLQVSGRTLFYAATLLRMKSEHLELSSDSEESVGDDDDEFYGENFDVALDNEIDYQGRLGPIERLEQEIQRRLDRKNMRKSPVTLFELIIELKNLEKEERRRRRISETGDDLLIYAEDVVGIAHDEGYQESAMTVLEECLDCISIEEEMTLAQICEKLGWGMPEVYIPLLFLAHEGRCSLRQEEFFGDVYVQICHANN
jgi:segregation and condensation protein A